MTRREVSESAADPPCVQEAFRTREPTFSNDLATEHRWPGFSKVVASLGYAAVAGLPMPATDQSIGALNIYRTQPHAWFTEEIETAQPPADMAAGYVINARRSIRPAS